MSHDDNDDSSSHQQPLNVHMHHHLFIFCSLKFISCSQQLLSWMTGLLWSYHSWISDDMCTSVILQLCDSTVLISRVVQRNYIQRSGLLRIGVQRNRCGDDVFECVSRMHIDEWQCGTDWIIFLHLRSVVLSGYLTISNV